MFSLCVYVALWLSVLQNIKLIASFHHLFACDFLLVSRMCKAKLVLISSMCARCSFAYADKWCLTVHFMNLVVFSWPGGFDFLKFFCFKLCEYWYFCFMVHCYFAIWGLNGSKTNCCPAFVQTETSFKPSVLVNTVKRALCIQSQQSACAFKKQHKGQSIVYQRDYPGLH